MAGNDFFKRPDTPNGLVLIDGPDRMTNGRNNGRGLDCRADHDSAWLGSLRGPLIRLFVQKIDGGLQLFGNATIANLFQDTDDGIPIVFFVKVPKLDSRAERPGKLRLAKVSFTIAAGDWDRRSDISKKRPGSVAAISVKTVLRRRHSNHSAGAGELFDRSDLVKLSQIITRRSASA